MAAPLGKKQEKAAAASAAEIKPAQTIETPTVKEPFREPLSVRETHPVSTLRPHEMGGAIKAADEVRTRHQHQVFDHQLSKLGVPAGASAEATVRKKSVAATIVAMLRDPAGIRQAIILNTILERSTDRTLP
jgi:hypothetical protein